MNPAATDRPDPTASPAAAAVAETAKQAAAAETAEMADRRGLLLFAHGARDPRWALPFQAVADACRQQRGAERVALAFLEFMTPDLPAAGATLAAAGCRQVDVVPLFLGAGGHVRKDLPLLMAQLAQAHPAVRWHLAPAVGQHPAVIGAMAQVALSAAEGVAAEGVAAGDLP